MEMNSGLMESKGNGMDATKVVEARGSSSRREGQSGRASYALSSDRKLITG